MVATNDPLHWEEKLIEAHNQGGEAALLGPNVTEEKLRINEELRAKALEILQHGNPFDFILDSCERFVLGSTMALKKLICCKTIQFVPSSQGLHPKLSGESGSGKTWTVQVFLHHLPDDAFIRGGLSPKALAYHQLGNKLFIFLDEYVQNDDLDKIIKETTSDFHSPYGHKTVINQKAATLYIGSEMTWALSSVDASQDTQLLNRSIPLNVDDSKGLTKKVNDKTIQAYGRGERKLFEDETVLICREIFKILAETENIPVVIPFWNRIEWLDATNRRNPSIFLDMLIGITAINFMQRDKDKAGNYLATETDYRHAVLMFTDKDAEELVKRFSRKEREIAEILVKHGGLKPSEIAQIMNISTARVSQIARGEDGKSGLLQKLPGFDIEESMVKRSDDKTVKQTLYKLSNFDHLEGFNQIVRLRPIKDVKGDLGLDFDDKIVKGEGRIKDIKDIKENMTDLNPSLILNSSFSLSLPKKPLISLIGPTDSDEKLNGELNRPKDLNRPQDSDLTDEDEEIESEIDRVIEEEALGKDDDEANP